jgi:excisionase family DNA binding protein
MIDGKLLTPEQVAERLQMSRLTIVHWLRVGKLPSIRLGKLYRVREGDLEATLQAHQHPGHRGSV